MPLLRETPEVSANCLFLALDATEWGQLRQDPDTQLDVPGAPLLYEKGAGGGAIFRGMVLQDDVAQVLELLLTPGRRPSLGPEAPFIGDWAAPVPIEEAVGQSTPLDNSAWYLPPDEVRKAARGLAGVSWEELASRYAPDGLRESGFGKLTEDLDALESWTEDDLPVLQESWRELVEYFQQAAEQHQGMLLLQEDGPIGSLGLGMR